MTAQDDRRNLFGEQDPGFRPPVSTEKPRSPLPALFSSYEGRPQTPGRAIKYILFMGSDAILRSTNQEPPSRPAVFNYCFEDRT